MQEILAHRPENRCDFGFVGNIHRQLYEPLPSHHQFTHSLGGFARHPVMPGAMRDTNVSLDGGRTSHGPDAQTLQEKYAKFSRLYDPARFHGDERLLVAAASHHLLGWLHPFRVGNGRVTRLFSGIYMAMVGLNRSNLWSLTRGLSKDRRWSMTNLQSADSPTSKGVNQAYFADYCASFLEVCLDQNCQSIGR
jgi:Fic family protein